MSLDVYLETSTKCPHCGGALDVEPQTVYRDNITHNLGKMADEAGIYKALWRPEELDPPATRASDIVPLLERGLARLMEDPEFFKKFDAPNGWGLYEHFVPFVSRYLKACEDSPDAAIRVSR